MTVIVKGMKMPKNCDDCFFIERGYPDWCSLPQIPNGEDEINDTKKRPDWCPLIELSEKHGRLIDADVLAFNLDGTMAVSPTGYIHGDTVADMIGDAPTIIEAEGD